ncbi:MAG: hypothetical protein WBP64_09635 [Nitrososphaeraceae archaeon]
MSKKLARADRKRISNFTLNNLKNIPIDSSQNIPIGLLGQCLRDGKGRRRRYVRAGEVENLACRNYKENGRGISFGDLLSNGLTLRKQQAQTMLKYCHRKGILFTVSNCKPQQYYPSGLKSEILKARMSKNIPIRVTGVRLTETGLLNQSPIIDQSLEGYVLPLLPKAPLHIHKMQFKVKVSPECYNEMALPKCDRNQGREHVEIIGKVRVSYRFYPNGTVMVFTESSNSPFKIEDEIDRSRIIAFFGQVRDRLVMFLMDRHERLVPDIMEWQLTQCDINKDLKVSDWFHLSSIKVQVKHLDHLFSVYIKSLGTDTVCRVEERKSLKHMPAIKFIDNVFNPFEKIETQSGLLARLEELSSKIEHLLKLIDILGYHHGGFSIYRQEEINSNEDDH